MPALAWRQSAFGFLLHVTALGCGFLTDLLISSYASTANIAAWSEIRALFGLTGLLCLCGLDLVMVRHPERAPEILRRLALQIPLLALPVAGLVRALGFLESFALAFLLCIAAACTAACFQYLRAHHAVIGAQLARQGWRYLLPVLVLIELASPQGFALGAPIIWALFAFSLLSALATGRHLRRHHGPDPSPPSARAAPQRRSLGWAYALGARFTLTSSTLALSIYAEQLLVQGLGTLEEAARYFTHATYFLFPAAIVNSYLAVLAAPWMRDNRARFCHHLHSHKGGILLLVALAAALLHGLGLLAWGLLLPRAEAPDPVLRLLFFLVTLLTTLYTVPSGFLGVFASLKAQEAMIALQFAALAGAALLCWGLQALLGWPLLHSVALAGLCNWGLRLGYGLHLVWRLSPPARTAT